MTARERFLNNLRYKQIDRIFNREFGWWQDTLIRWHREGLPEEIDTNEKADSFFGIEQFASVPVDIYLNPPFQTETLEETSSYKVVRDGDGVISKIFADGTSSIPHYIKFPIETRDDWIEFKKRLNPETPRYPANWDEIKMTLAASKDPVIVGGGSLFGWIRNWMGFENALISFHTQPELIDEMVGYLAEFTLAVLERAFREVRIDAVFLWEDMAFKTQPMISPALFNQYLAPRYKKMTQRYHQAGIEFVLVDCDGNINQLAGPWLENGVNVMFPLEINSGSDPVKLRKRFGRELLLMGGVDKIALIKGKDAIDKELERIAPVVNEGGYIPHVDHRVPPDVSLKNYLYYLRRKKEIFGITDWDIPDIA